MNPESPGYFPLGPPFRVGHGYDIHRLEPLAADPGSNRGGRPLVLGGVRLEHDRGPVGHSDGDALLHAITDALLGAVGAPDIGRLFPDTDARWRGADSSIFLHEAVRRVAAAGYSIGNVDATVILERPKLAPHRAAIVVRIAQLLGVDPAVVNVKGKTHEGVDATGEGRAIEAYAVVLLTRHA